MTKSTLPFSKNPRFSAEDLTNVVVFSDVAPLVIARVLSSSGEDDSARRSSKASRADMTMLSLGSAPITCLKGVSSRVACPELSRN